MTAISPAVAARLKIQPHDDPRVARADLEHKMLDAVTVKLGELE